MSMKNVEKRKSFTASLMLWNTMHNARIMPWKGEKDPYKIWLSEIILQQTRVEQGLAYYEKFVKNYPTITDLALADDKKVFKLWEGLGYYSRCKNLLASARHIAFELKGVFPGTYTEILTLKGVGPYTSAAIASFAYNLPHAVLDGNVQRLLARFFGIETAVDSTSGKQLFSALSQDLLDKNNPSLYNQAIMDFGATVCKPKLPVCEICVLQRSCTAFAKNKINELPLKEKKLVKRVRHLYYVVAHYKEEVYIKQRIEKDIWQSLWEFILLEQANAGEPADVLKTPLFRNLVGQRFQLLNVSLPYKQQLTHQTVYASFIAIKLSARIKSDNYTAVTKTGLSDFAFPKIISRYLQQEQPFNNVKPLIFL